MIDLNSPESVREQLNRGVAGFCSREDMRAHIIACTEQRGRRGHRLVPGLCAAAAVLLLELSAGHQGRCPFMICMLSRPAAGQW